MEVKASLGFGVSSFAFFPPALAAAAAFLFGGMILFENLSRETRMQFNPGQAQTCPAISPSLILDQYKWINCARNVTYRVITNQLQHAGTRLTTCH